jgi:hypothetical protein
MSTVTLYRFEVYDITTDEFRRSRRWATLAAISSIPGAQAIESSAVVIDENRVLFELPGMTSRDFHPHASTGFQTQVRT